jgi:hypothetical protein
MPSGASLMKRKVLWALPVTDKGFPGWIVSEIAGGPPDPRSAMLGTTMRLKCTKKLDKNTPQDFVDNKEGVRVAFTLDNYETRWCLLEPLSSDEAQS